MLFGKLNLGDPNIYLPHVKTNEMKHLLTMLYTGKVKISKKGLPGLHMIKNMLDLVVTLPEIEKIMSNAARS